VSRGGRRAALPDAQWRPPERLIENSGGTVVRFIEEKPGTSKSFDFAPLPVEPAMQRWLARAFLNRTGARSAQKRLSTVGNLFGAIRMFAAVLAGSAVRGPHDLTPAHIAAFRLRHAAVKSGTG
jgi:hypothetical protein